MSKNSSRYLLSSQCVFNIICDFQLSDIINCLNHDAVIWPKVVDSPVVHAEDIYISAVTEMRVMGELRQRIVEKKTEQRTGDTSLSLLRDCEKRALRFFDIFNKFANGAHIIPMDHKIASTWDDLIGHVYHIQKIQ